MTTDRSHSMPEESGGALPDVAAIARDIGSHAQAVLIVATDETSRDHFAARLAVALAEAIGRSGRRVLLADLAFDEPVLHDLLDEPNGEGVADILLFGASADHVVLSSPARSFGFVPPGAVAPDPSGLLAHEGWVHLLGQLATSETLLLAFVPSAAPGLGALAKRISDIVLVAPAGVTLEDVGLPASARVLANLPERKGAVTQERDAVFERIRLPRDAEREALIADLRSRQRGGLAESGSSRWVAGRPESPVHPRPIVGVPADSADAAITEPPLAAGRGGAGRRRRGNPVLLTMLLLLLISVLAGVWHFGREYWQARRPAALVDPGNVAPAATLTGDPIGVPLPYSVAIEAHQELRTAVRRSETLARADTSVGFYIAPILVDDVLYYRVMAGPVRDSASAAAVMESLRAQRLKTGGTEHDIRATPYAFLIGEYETEDQAQDRMQQLRALDIPAYVIEIPYSAGPPRYYLYSGAYSGPAEAEVMRQLLRNTGLADTLVERTGRSSP